MKIRGRSRVPRAPPSCWRWRSSSHRGARSRHDEPRGTLDRSSTWREMSRRCAGARRSRACASSRAPAARRRPTADRAPRRAAGASGPTRRRSAARERHALCDDVEALARDPRDDGGVRPRCSSPATRSWREIEAGASRRRALPAAAGDRARRAAARALGRRRPRAAPLAPRARDGSRASTRRSSTRSATASSRSTPTAASSTPTPRPRAITRADRPRPPRRRGLARVRDARATAGAARATSRRSRARTARRRSSTTPSRRCSDGDGSTGATVIFRDVSERARAERRSGPSTPRRACWRRPRASPRPRTASPRAVCAALGWEFGARLAARRQRAADDLDVVADRGAARRDPRGRRRPGRRSGAARVRGDGVGGARAGVDRATCRATTGRSASTVIRERDLHAALAVPILSDGRCLGVLEFVDTVGAGARPGLREHDDVDRRVPRPVHRAPPRRAGARDRARRGARGGAAEVRVRGQHEPRDPHADERRARA